MVISGKYLRKSYDEKGAMELTIKVDSLMHQEMLKALDKEKTYKIEITEAKSTRTLQQNKLMWELIHQIAIERSTERANNDWEIYLEALEKAGAKFEFIAVIPKAEEILKQQFRAIKKMNSFTQNGQTFNTYKVYYGSSKMNTKEMNLLMETVLDMAEMEGIDTSMYE